MTNSALLRNRLYWMHDSCKGGRVKKHYSEIEQIFEDNDSDYAKQKISGYLKGVLEHVIKTVPYYSKRGLRPNIEEFPLVNKNIVRSCFKDFISGPYQNKKLYQITTSGSTGTPFTILQNSEKRHRHIADNIFFNNSAGAYLGIPIYYFRVWNVLNRKSKFKFWIQNIIPVDSIHLTDDNFHLFFERIAEESTPKAFLAYASTYEAMVKYMETSNGVPKCNVKAVLSMSESLPELARNKLAHFFQCPVISRYSNMENGFIAQQCDSNCGEYHINSASFLVEIFDMEKDKPVTMGEWGRIVITDYFNYAMPLIRYDTGDIGILNIKSHCGQKTSVLSKLEGRRVDFINDSDGNLLSPHVITNTLWKYGEVLQFQFIQEKAGEYVMRLNVGCLNQFERVPELIDEMKSYLGKDAEIRIEYVSEIPSLASGKRKKIINLQIGK